jgi:hypothetical protein
MGIFSRSGREPRPPLGSAFVFPDRTSAARRRERMDDLARRLRRVRADLASCRSQEFLPGKRTRVQAGRLAYVDLLTEACELLEVPHELDRLAGVDRQLEILRVEAALGSAGLDLQPAC